MTERQPTRDDILRVWNAMARVWDNHMETGRTWQRRLVAPAVERLMCLQAGERVLEIACGNGEFARRMATLGARVLATDFSEGMLERARAHGGQVDYRLADATDRGQLLGLATDGPFDACVCNMAIMDIPDLAPMASAVRELLRPGGRLVFSTQHPAFNSGSVTRMVEQFDDENGVRRIYSVKVSRYTRPHVGLGVALEDQPDAQWYFDRSLSAIVGVFFRHGFVLDGVEEPVFDPADVTPGSPSAVFTEIPPVFVARLR